MRDFQLNLVESELKIILEALTDMEKKMCHTCDTSNDEDEIADVGNELIELRLLLKPLQEKAVSKYGKGIINFSRQLL